MRDSIKEIGSYVKNGRKISLCVEHTNLIHTEDYTLYLMKGGRVCMEFRLVRGYDWKIQGVRNALRDHPKLNEEWNKYHQKKTVCKGFS